MLLYFNNFQLILMVVIQAPTLRNPELEKPFAC